jgi:hypothetical protein
MKRCRLLLAMALAGLATPALAQDGVDWSGLMAGIAHGSAMDEAAQESTAPARRARTERSRTDATNADLRFTPSIERRRANLARFLDRMRARDRKGSEALAAELRATDVIAKMADELAPYGMRIDNVVDAYAIWWLNAWLASRQRTDTPPAPQVAAVRKQTAEALTGLPQLTSATDAEKQAMAENNLLLSLLIGSSLEQAKSDPAQLRRIAAAVREGARASGLDLDSMDLTVQGFIARREGAVRGAPPNGASARTGEVGTAAPYALAAIGVAAAAGGIWMARSRRSKRAPPES